MRSLFFIKKNSAVIKTSNPESGLYASVEEVKEVPTTFGRVIRLLSVFAVAFLVIVLLVNIGNIFGIANDSINPKLTEEEKNIQMTEFYRKTYGYGSGYPDDGFGGSNVPELAVYSGVGGVAGDIDFIPTNNNSQAQLNNSTASINSSAQAIYSNYVYIPKLGVKVPLVTSSKTDSKSLLAELNKGVLIYPQSSIPGDGGMTVIIGHSSSNTWGAEYGRVFSGLSKLSGGDQIFINFNGKDYTYNVEIKRTGTVQELAGLGITNDLVLATCWPIGTDKNRIIIGANLQR